MASPAFRLHAKPHFLGMPESCLIIGGGIAGIAAALSLSKIGISCTVYELRATPSTIGGAVHLTPNALRLLEYLDVEVHGCRVDSIEIFSLHTGKSLGEVPSRKYGPSLRILREELLKAMLRTADKKEITVVYESKLLSIRDESGHPKVTAVFANGKEARADFILGCDGVHSVMRTQYVHPSRLPIYTNVAAAYSIVDAGEIKVHFRQTSMNSGRFGSLLMSYFDPERSKIYLAAVMETPEMSDKQGWRVRGNDRERTLEEINKRYRNSPIPCIDELINKVDDFIFYPVYKLGPGGDWSRARVLLLGDAAHAMPPQGESTGLAIEDGVLLARVFSSSPEMSTEEVFRLYEKTRRLRIDTAYQEALSRWEQVKDRSWFMQKVVEWLMWVILWYKMDTFESSMSYDVRKEEIIR